MSHGQMAKTKGGAIHIKKPHHPLLPTSMQFTSMQLHIYIFHGRKQNKTKNKKKKNTNRENENTATLAL